MSLFAPNTWPPWIVMWAVAGLIFVACKALTWLGTPTPPTPAWRHVAYLVAWPGLDARAFLSTRPLLREQRPAFGEWVFAVAKLTFGAAVVWGVTPLIPSDAGVLRGWVGMLGVVFILHFGVFHLLSCAWRAAGIDVKPLMNWPLLAVSVSEFWGKRWNLAFRDITHRFVFRPFASRGRARVGVAAVFILSGVIHDLVISVPAGGWYGGPTLYFVAQWLGLLAAKSLFGKRLGLGEGWRGRLFTAIVVVGPAYLLFHPAFVFRVVLPFLNVLGVG